MTYKFTADVRGNNFFAKKGDAVPDSVPAHTVVVWEKAGLVKKSKKKLLNYTAIMQGSEAERAEK